MLGLPPIGKKTEAGTLRWVALGDSLTVGHGAVPEQSYPSRVAALSHATSSKLELVKNLGNGGHTLAKVQLLQMTRLGLYQPDVVSIWVGTNDALLNAVMEKKFDLASREALPTSPENFQRRVHDTIDKLQKHSVKHIFIGKLHDVANLPVAQDWDDEKRAYIKSLADQYNAIFETAAQENDRVSLVPLDQIPSLVDPFLYMRDGIHPKPQVYVNVAQAFWTVMQEKLPNL